MNVVKLNLLDKHTISTVKGRVRTSPNGKYTAIQKGLHNVDIYDKNAYSASIPILRDSSQIIYFDWIQDDDDQKLVAISSTGSVIILSLNDEMAVAILSAFIPVMNAYVYISTDLDIIVCLSSPTGKFVTYRVGDNGQLSLICSTIFDSPVSIITRMDSENLILGFQNGIVRMYNIKLKSDICSIMGAEPQCNYQTNQGLDLSPVERYGQLLNRAGNITTKNNVCITAIVYLEDAKLIVVGDMSGTIDVIQVIHDGSTYEMLHYIPGLYRHQLRVSCILVIKECKLVSCCTDGTSYSWDIIRKESGVENVPPTYKFSESGCLMRPCKGAPIVSACFFRKYKHDRDIGNIYFMSHAGSIYQTKCKIKNENLYLSDRIYPVFQGLSSGKCNSSRISVCKDRRIIGAITRYGCAKIHIIRELQFNLDDNIGDKDMLSLTKTQAQMFQTKFGVGKSLPQLFARIEPSKKTLPNGTTAKWGYECMSLEQTGKYVALGSPWGGIDIMELDIDEGRVQPCGISSILKNLRLIDVKFIEESECMHNNNIIHPICTALVYAPKHIPKFGDRGYHIVALEQGIENEWTITASIKVPCKKLNYMTLSQSGLDSRYIVTSDTKDIYVYKLKLETNDEGIRTVKSLKDTKFKKPVDDAIKIRYICFWTETGIGDRAIIFVNKNEYLIYDLATAHWSPLKTLAIKNNEAIKNVYACGNKIYILFNSGINIFSMETGELEETLKKSEANCQYIYYFHGQDTGVWSKVLESGRLLALASIPELPNLNSIRTNTNKRQKEDMTDFTNKRYRSRIKHKFGTG